MGIGRDLFNELNLCPSKLLHCFEVPPTQFHRQIRFQNHNILRPSKLQRQRKHIWMILISPVEIPHPA